NKDLQASSEDFEFAQKVFETFRRKVSGILVSLNNALPEVLPDTKVTNEE
ncbi:hypothetical protein LY76DRAFT_521798, partial [Colletotrichum caudatum]